MKLANLEHELEQGRGHMPCELPSVVRQRIDQTLASLPEHHRRRKMKVSSAFGLSAAVLCAIMVGSGFVFPQAAAALRQLPGIVSVFKFAGDYGLKAADEKGLVTAVEQSITDQGITVQIKEVMYDGSRISIGYIQQSDDPTQEMTRGLDFQINGKRYKPALSGTGSPVDEHTYAGVIDLMPAEDLPNHFKLQMDISQIGSTKGRWSFSIPVTKMASTNKVVLPMITKSYGDITLTVKKVLFTPGSTELDVEVKQPADAGRFIQYDLFDDKGTQLQRRSGSGRGQTDGKNIHINLLTALRARQPIAKTITIRPFVDLPFQGPLKESKAPLDQMPTEEKPISLSQGEAGHLLITQVERLPDKTLVHYRTEGLIPQEQAKPLWIEDSGGNKYLQLQKPSITVDPVHYRFVKEFPAFTEKEQLTFVTRELTPPGYLKELEITVPLEP